MKRKQHADSLITLKKKLDAIIMSEIQNGARKNREARNWGDTGADIMTAVEMATASIHSISASSEKEFLTSCLERIHEAHIRYKRDYDDDSGLGSASLHQIKAGIITLAQANGISMVMPELPDVVSFTHIPESEPETEGTETITEVKEAPCNKTTCTAHKRGPLRNLFTRFSN